MAHTRLQAAGEHRMTQDVTHNSKSIRMKTLGSVAIALAIALTVLAIITIYQIFDTNSRFEQSNTIYDACKDASYDLQQSSDYLTSQSRMYVTTGDRHYLDNYLEEINSSNRRTDAVNTLKSNLDNSAATTELERALEMSNTLAETEMHAMRLAADAYDATGVQSAAIGGTISDAEAVMTDAEKVSVARELLLSHDYDELKGQITYNIDESVIDIVNGFDRKRIESENQLRLLLMRMAIATAVLLVIVIIVVIAIYQLTMRPLGSYMQSIYAGQPLKPQGTFEMRYFADAYNSIYEKNMLKTESLRKAAEHDPLTGLMNRGAYDAFISGHLSDTALLIFDVDHFKMFNDRFGHDVGDAVLQKVARSITHSFRATDFAARIGGDEFAVVMTNVSPDMSPVIIAKLVAVKKMLCDRSDGLPEITLSIGIAFSGNNTQDASIIYRHADRALYKAKENGRDTYSFYSISEQENATGE